jgi:hypothetical protein
MTDIYDCRRAWDSVRSDNNFELSIDESYALPDMYDCGAMDSWMERFPKRRGIALKMAIEYQRRIERIPERAEAQKDICLIRRQIPDDFLRDLKAMVSDSALCPITSKFGEGMLITIRYFEDALDTLYVKMDKLLIECYGLSAFESLTEDDREALRNNVYLLPEPPEDILYRARWYLEKRKSSASLMVYHIHVMKKYFLRLYENPLIPLIGCGDDMIRKKATLHREIGEAGINLVAEYMEEAV